MLEAINSSAIQCSNSALSFPAPAQNPPTGDVAEFNQIFLSTQPGSNEMNFGIHQLQQNSHLPDSVGTALVDGLGKMSNEYDKKVLDLEAMVGAMSEGKPMSMAEMLKVQIAVTDISMQHQLTTTVVGKSTDGVKTLFRNQ